MMSICSWTLDGRRLRVRIGLALAGQTATTDGDGDGGGGLDGVGRVEDDGWFMVDDDGGSLYLKFAGLC